MLPYLLSLWEKVRLRGSQEVTLRLKAPDPLLLPRVEGTLGASLLQPGPVAERSGNE